MARAVRKKSKASSAKAKTKKTKKKAIAKSRSSRSSRAGRLSATARKSAKVKAGRLTANLIAQSGPDRVARAIALLGQGTVYSKGCSGFVCDVLQIDYEQAKDIMSGSDIDSNSVGTWPNYDFSNVNPGNICGWLAADATDNPPTDHVTIYIGQADKLFIDVAGVNQAPRTVKNGYGRQQKVWKCQNF